MRREHLIQDLKKWREQGGKLVLLIDANEDMTNGPLQTRLEEELDMYDTVKEVGNAPPTATFHLGSRQIDGAWATRDLDIARACFLPFQFGVGDHRGILLDIRTSSLLGHSSSQIVRPNMRRLQNWNSRVRSRY